MNYIWDITTNYASRGGLYKTIVEQSFIEKHLPKTKVNILDIGGGSGRFAIPLEQMGHSVSVIDINKEALNILHNRNNNIALINKDFETYKSRIFFDVFLMIEVQENFRNLNLVYNKIYQMANEKAVLIFTALNSGSFKYKIRKMLSHHPYPGIRDYITYKKTLLNSGFNIIDALGFNWLPFRVNTESLLVPFFARLEQTLHLNKWLSQSPELLFCVRKS